MSATNDVENNISSRAISPCLVSKHFEKGSVVYMRKPLEVPVSCWSDDAGLRPMRRRTYSQMAVVLVKSHIVQRHDGPA